MELRIEKLFLYFLSLRLSTLNIRFAVKTLTVPSSVREFSPKNSVHNCFRVRNISSKGKIYFYYQRQADDSAPVANSDLELTNFRRSRNRMRLADILRNYEKKNLKDPVNEEE